jgi:hypothetical protein
MRDIGHGFEKIALAVFIECDDVGFALQSGNRLWRICRGIDVSGKPYLHGIRSGQRIGLPRSSTTEDAVERESRIPPRPSVPAETELVHNAPRER